MTLPPIAGVANGAMVMHDTLFTDMSHEMMEKVLKPKLDGTNHLDDLFQETNLDFFVLFSSIVCVCGNIGQSNYAAANAYLKGLAAQRRQRGLAASAFDIGRVVGIGYVERVSQGVQDQMVKNGFMPISESDFHQMFAETIHAGRPESGPESGANPAFTTGIGLMRDDADAKAPWFDNPRFSHCIVEAGVESISKEGKKTGLPVIGQLVNATTTEEALDTLKGKSVRTSLQDLCSIYSRMLLRQTAAHSATCSGRNQPRPTTDSR